MGGGGGGGGTTFPAPSVDGALHSCSLRPRDVDSLGTVVCGDNVELDELAIAEGRHSMLAIAVLDIIPVGEDIVTLVGQRDETISLFHIKPLDVANCWGGGSSRHAGGLCRVEKGQDGDDRTELQGSCADAKVVVSREFGWLMVGEMRFSQLSIYIVVLVVVVVVVLDSMTRDEFLY